MTPALLLHAAATWFMVGLIWFVQVVHYPLFGGVGPGGFAAYASDHQRRTTWVVLPPMVTELVLAIWIAARLPGGVPAWSAWVGLTLVVAVWVSTFALQVPRHRDLAVGYDSRAHAALVRTNWVRIAAWSARGVLAGLMLWWAETA